MNPNNILEQSVFAAYVFGEDLLRHIETLSNDIYLFNIYDFT